MALNWGVVGNIFYTNYRKEKKIKMDSEQYRYIIGILEEIQCKTNTQNEAPLFYEHFKEQFIGLKGEYEMGNMYLNFLAHLQKIDLPTKYESAYYYDYLKKSLDLLCNESNSIYINGKTLNYDKPVIGSVNFHHFDARALNENGVKLILISRSIIHFMCTLSSLVAQFYLNLKTNKSNRELDRYFVDLACSYYLFREGTKDTKYWRINTIEGINIASSLVITSYLFIVAHEYAHLLLEHNKSSVQDVPFQKEMEADFLGGMLSMRVIYGQYNHTYSVAGLTYILGVLDLLYDIDNIIKEEIWNPKKALYPKPRIKIFPEVIKYFNISKNNDILSTNMWICLHNLWARNKDKIKEYLTLYESFPQDRDAYKKLQDKIYSI